MRIPVIQGVIDRRILVNYRVAPEAMAGVLPPPFRPLLVHGYAIGGICLIRLKQVRPRRLPLPMGIGSENAAHRIAVQWEQDGERREGVYIPRRDTDSRLNAYRMIHKETSQCIIGPHIIDTQGNVRTFTDLVDIRLTGNARHLTDPANKVYFVGMEGEFYEADLHNLDVNELCDLKVELEMGRKLPPHFKDAFTSHGKVFVANNSYYTADFDRGFSDGRLAEWDGQTWTVLERTQFNTLAGRLAGDISDTVFAVGQDRASAILRTYQPDRGW